MTKAALLILAFLPGLTGFAGAGSTDLTEETQTEKSLPDYFVISDRPDQSVAKNASAILFRFALQGNDSLGKAIRYSVNGSNRTWELQVAGKRELLVRPGKYVFKFWYDEGYFEITTDSITLSAAHYMELQVNFKSATMMQVADKPVIYLYPQKDTQVNVELQVKGRLLFTYPVLLDNGWSVLAHPGGSMETGGKTYNYLFWEGELNTAKADFSEAWEVHRNNLVSFLETKLGAMGLNTRETGDFITYWVPRMNANEVNEITFLVNEECDAYAKLNVSPAPDQVFRVFMVWRKGAEESDMEFKGRDLPVFRRDGFTVLEWGGSELKLLPVK